ncbi:MAG: hypothetical protein HOP29_09315 [Phycisphaerales bacterium]|nr:hypothetical protein [Phycisphaerales bacterium]
MTRVHFNGGATLGADDLAALLDRIAVSYAALHECLEEKLACLRCAELENIDSFLGRERLLAAQLIEQDGMRRRIMEQLGRPYGMSAEKARGMPVRRLAERLGEPHSSRLCAAADRLKEQIGRTQALAGMVERVSRDVLVHVREMFAAVAAPFAGGEGYCPRGATRGSRPRELFEAVG